ncbi:MAG: Fimbrial protein [Proteobacteria bacterium]|nr:Fimbrial protein [Pseudomonadota bacterium]
MNLISKMRKLTILAIAAVFPGMASAISDTTTITITGTVIDNTCTLNTNNAIFTLPDVSIREFDGKANVERGSVAVPITFTNCGADLKAITVKISGTPDDAIPGTIFKNTGSAVGVGVRLYDTDDWPFKPDGSSNAVSIKPNNGAASTTYTAKYVSTSANIKAGSVSTVITAVFTYN